MTAEHGDDTTASPRLLAVGTATPPRGYTQREVLERFGITDRRVISLFRNSHIHRRHLFLPEGAWGQVPVETQEQLLARHRSGALRLGRDAVEQCLARSGVAVTDIGYLCCVTSTGFLCPGLSAHLLKHLGLREDCGRVDVVGMGCNAGLNGLHPVVAWCSRNPGRYALLLCVEVCSAAYVVDGTMRTAVVNALFGDGAAALLVGTEAPRGVIGDPHPRPVDFDSQILPEAIEAMRFDWQQEHQKFSFYLDPEIPYVIAANVARPVTRLLGRNGLARRDIRHWLVHSGGKKVIDGIKYNLDLTDHDLRHTLSVLREYGNLSSGSFLFSYQRLVRERVVEAGDLGVMLTMGPGTTIEAVLLRW